MLMMVLHLRRTVIAAVTLGLVGGVTPEEEREVLRRAEWKGRPGLVPNCARRSIASDAMWNNLIPYSALAKSWSFAHFMSVANMPIVHTTADSLGYGAAA